LEKPAAFARIGLSKTPKTAAMNEVSFLDPNQLHAHEEVDPERVERIETLLRGRAHFFPPLLVDGGSNVILDGHHRYEASKRLGCVRIPCYVIDYVNDEDVVLESWRADMSFSKQEVIDKGRSGELFPIKTTRHLYKLPDGIEPVPLARLSDGPDAT